MKQITLLSIITATLLFTGCGEETKKAAAEATVSNVEAVQEKTDKVVEETQAKVEETIETTQALMAPTVFDKCKGCHGANGQQAAMGKSAIIAGQDKETLIASMKAYQAGTRNEVGFGGLMKGQLASVTDEDINAIAEYLSKQ
ncbi:MAG: hypothetical protein RLZZ428_404 [Pseudomonadota bacterium]|jgi:cytochrome c553